MVFFVDWFTLLGMKTIFWMCLFALLSSACNGDCSSKSTETAKTIPVEQLALLNSVIHSGDASPFRERLVLHGPILANETNYLIEKSQSHSENVRRNASRLLVLSRDESVDEPLQKSLEWNKKRDLVAFCILLKRFLEKPNAATIVHQYQAQIEQGLHSNDNDVLPVAIYGGLLLHLPEAEKKVVRLFDNTLPSIGIISDVVKILRVQGIDTRESDLVKILLAQPSKVNSFGYLYEVLCNSNDPKMADVFRISLQTSDNDKHKHRDFSNGVHFSKSRKPLTFWEESLVGRFELVRICRRFFEEEAPKLPEWQQSNIECSRFLQERGKRPFREDDLQGMLAFAKEWMAAHPKQDALK